LLDHTADVLRLRDRREVRPAVAASTERAVAGRTVVGEDCLACGGVRCCAGACMRLWLDLAGMRDRMPARVAAVTGPSFPSSENSQRLSPRAEPASAFPPA
jgi:hypothetical protein